MPILQPNQLFEKYHVQYLIKENSYCETYKVEDEHEKAFFLKLYVKDRFPERLLDHHGHIGSIELSLNLDHESILKVLEHGEKEIDGVGICSYIITEYYAGELLEDRLNRDWHLPMEESLRIYKRVMEGLRYLHTQYPPLIHNDITPRNILLTNDGGVKIIDLGHLSYCKNYSGEPPFDYKDLDIRYLAGETMIYSFNEKSDIFSATAVFYHMLFADAPWFPDVKQVSGKSWFDRFRNMASFRSKPLDFCGKEMPEKWYEIINKGLALNPKQRYTNAKEVLYYIEKLEESDSEHESLSNLKGHHGPWGFKGIAGMGDLKKMLNERVLFLMKDKDKVEKYKLTPPNGLLLYGPPGCGKSFFAEKFAEECGYYFMLVKMSSIGSTLVHGTEENIAKLFAEAEEHAPTILCFDEFDAFVPARTTYEGRNQAGEVNEFLTHLNNCGERGVFVIATSNRPDMIDPAVLRTGRIDKQIFVPLPDEEARMEMFNMYLKGRPCEIIDTKVLAEMTDGYIASDISYICNETAMIAALNDKQITQELLETTIRSIRPSIRPDVIKMYDDIRDKMEGITRKNTFNKIGFK